MPARHPSAQSRPRSSLGAQSCEQCARAGRNCWLERSRNARRISPSGWGLVKGKSGANHARLFQHVEHPSAPPHRGCRRLGCCPATTPSALCSNAITPTTCLPFAAISPTHRPCGRCRLYPSTACPPCFSAGGSTSSLAACLYFSSSSSSASLCRPTKIPSMTRGRGVSAFRWSGSTSIKLPAMVEVRRVALFRAAGNCQRFLAHHFPHLVPTRH